jgi:hypothetical protein
MTQIETTDNGYNFRGGPKFSPALAMSVLLAGSLILTVGILCIFRGLIADGQGIYMWIAGGVASAALGAFLAYTGYRNPSIDMQIDRTTRRLTLLHYANGRIRKEVPFALSDIRAIVTGGPGRNKSLQDSIENTPDNGQVEYVTIKLDSGRQCRLRSSYPESREIQKLLREAVNAEQPVRQPGTGQLGRSFGRRSG